MGSKNTHYLQRKYFFYTLTICIAAGVILYGTAWGLVMTTNVTRDAPFLKKLFITDFGDFSSNHSVDLDERGIRVYPPTPDAKILKAYQGRLTYVHQITGNSFADNSVHTGDVGMGSLHLEDFGIPMITTISALISGVCPAGEAMIGVSNGLPDCTPLSSIPGGGPIGFNNCAPGYVQEITSTGLIVCDGGSQILPSSNIWHQSTVNTSDIFYGTLLDDNDGNVGVGLDNPLTKLHVYSSRTGRIVFNPSVFTYTGGGTNTNVNPCPYVSGLAITSPLCFRHHGICGTANGQTFPTAPSSNLCALGNPSVVAGNGPRSWTCLGVNGGNNSPTCTATQSNNGQCGSANGTTYREAPTASQRCAVGTPQITNVYAAGTTYFEQWVCQGVNGGAASSSCIGYPVTAGMCNALSKVGSSQNPINGNADLCDGSIVTSNNVVVGASIGSLTTISTNPITRTWYCNGFNGGPSSLECKTSYWNGTNTRYHAECGAATQTSAPLTTPPTTSLCGNITTATVVGGSMTTVTSPAGIQRYRWTCAAPGKNSSYCYAEKQ